MRKLQLHISNKCSLKCSYCVSNMNRPGAGKDQTIIDKIGVDKYLEHIDRVFGKYYPLEVSLGGPGEPTENKDFTKIADHFIEKGNDVMVFTNLVNIYPLMKVKDKSHLTVTGSYHLDGMIEKPWVIPNKVDVLVEDDVVISRLITPLSPKVLENIKLYLHWVDVMKYDVGEIYPVQMYHFYNGKEYPKSYTDKEAELVKTVIGLFREPDFDDVRDVRNGGPSKGADCRIFDEFVMVLMNGTIERCQSEPRSVIGHISTFDGEVYGPARACPFEGCLCRSFWVEYAGGK